MISKKHILGFVALCLGVVACTKSDIDDSSSDTDVPPGGVVLTYDCEDLELNFNDTCFTAAGAIGLVDSTCACDPLSNDFDCPGLGNIGDPCQDGWGVITADCDCVEDTTGGSIYDCPEISANYGDSCYTALGIGEVNMDCECDAYDCQNWVANFGDPCWTTDAAGNIVEGIVDELCDCYVAGDTTVWDCPDLNANIGDDCQSAPGVIGVVSADCECIENTIEWDCPEIQANVGDSCFTSFFWGTVDADCECQP